MFTPHKVTLFNSVVNGDTIVVYSTILDGVFLDDNNGSGLTTAGAQSAGGAKLYIPFSCKAISAMGIDKTYLSPKAFANINDKSNVWTIAPSGKGSGANCYFVKGIVKGLYTYKQLKAAFDDVYEVTSVKTCDYGAADMQHWEVGAV